VNGQGRSKGGKGVPWAHVGWINCKTSGQRILKKGHMACHAATEDWIFPFAACHYWQRNDPFCCKHHSKTANAFECTWQPISWANLNPYL